MITILLIVWLALSAFCAYAIYAASAVSRDAEMAWRDALANDWPEMPNLSGQDIFLEQYGSPTGKEE